MNRLRHEFPNMHRVVLGNETDGTQILWKNGDYFDTWCEEMDSMGYDVVEHEEGGMYERLQHAPHGTVVYCYSYWRLVEKVVV